MYNRYIPQSDGSYKRSQIADPAHPPVPRRQRPQVPEEPDSIKQEPEKSHPLPPNRCSHCTQRNKYKPHPEEKQSTGLFPFLRQLLPKDFDTGDLIVVLLLLLMSADSNEENSSALLTLALYLFL